MRVSRTADTTALSASPSAVMIMPIDVLGHSCTQTRGCSPQIPRLDKKVLGSVNICFCAHGPHTHSDTVSAPVDVVLAHSAGGIVANAHPRGGDVIADPAEYGKSDDGYEQR